MVEGRTGSTGTDKEGGGGTSIEGGVSVGGGTTGIGHEGERNEGRREEDKSEVEGREGEVSKEIGGEANKGDSD